MNTTYILALYEQAQREHALRDAASVVAREMVSEPEHGLDVASEYASVRAHQNWFRRLAGLPEFAE